MAVGGEGGEEVADGAVVAGEKEAGTEVAERLEDEAALAPAGMGDDEAAGADDLAAVVEEVDVDGSRGVALGGALAAEVGLDLLEAREEAVDVEGGADEQDGVEEADVLVFFGDADGFGFVDGRGGE